MLSVDYSKLDDKVLLRLIASAEENALGELYDRYARLVYSIAMHTVGDGSLAEEITQDVFLRIWEKAHTYRAELSRVATWITSITRNRAIDVFRRSKTRPEIQPMPWAEGNAPEPADPQNLESSVELSQRRRRVRQAIAQLPEGQQEALALAYFQGYSHREIAQTLDQPLGTVKTRIRLGMQKLRHLLMEENSAP